MGPKPDDQVTAAIGKLRKEHVRPLSRSGAYHFAEQSQISVKFLKSTAAVQNSARKIKFYS